MHLDRSTFPLPSLFCSCRRAGSSFGIISFSARMLMGNQGVNLTLRWHHNFRASTYSNLAFLIVSSSMRAPNANASLVSHRLLFTCTTLLSSQCNTFRASTTVFCRIHTPSNFSLTSLDTPKDISFHPTTTYDTSFMLHYVTAVFCVFGVSDAFKGIVSRWCASSTASPVAYWSVIRDVARRYGTDAYEALRERSCLFHCRIWGDRLALALMVCSAVRLMSRLAIAIVVALCSDSATSFEMGD